LLFLESRARRLTRAVCWEPCSGKSRHIRRMEGYGGRGVLPSRLAFRWQQFTLARQLLRTAYGSQKCEKIRELDMNDAGAPLGGATGWDGGRR
jgi:hypothetical protein